MRKLLAAIVLATALLSCTNVNESIGGNFIATNLKYDFFTAEFDLDEVWMKPVDSLSGYSSRRINFGAVRDDNYGLFKRGCALTLVPVLREFDFGTDPVFRRFKFQAESDSVSIGDESEGSILQNVNVYALEESLLSNRFYSRTAPKYGEKRITKGVPVVNGTDSLVFDFTEEFGKKYLSITSEDLKDFEEYNKKFPGIYITTDDPAGNGGRFNMFKMNITDSYNGTIYRTDNYAVLYFSGIYNGERRDSSLMFYFSPPEFQNLDSLINLKVQPEQYVFNVDSHESDYLAGKADDKVYIEGGSGLKPVIPADEIRRLVNPEIISKGGDPTTALISKATIVLPFEFPEDYKSMYLFPRILSPSVKITRDSSVVFAGLTDASVSTENQGDINRSLCNFAPDVTHHVQQIIRKVDDPDISDYDIWMLIMRYESTTTTNAEASEMADFYQQMAYYSYYNQLYGGGYGGYGGMYGYGGYGGYGYGYNNYYNYMMMAQYANASASKTTTSTELDKDHYYNCHLNGPGAAGNKPKLKITFALPRE
ncbi:MAG: DUF4270 family protein [Bacteroidales bacterium]|nr:DUF4270 family protein [Bacteroidales bacterium]